MKLSTVLISLFKKSIKKKYNFLFSYKLKNYFYKILIFLMNLLIRLKNKYVTSFSNQSNYIN